MKNSLRCAAVLAAVSLLAGCGAQPGPTPPTAPAVDLAVIATQPPEGTPLAIPEARARIQPGDPVVLAGKIMGVKSPFVEGRAVFVIGDENTLTSCDLKGEEDHCETPWDACCDTPEARRAGTATIQVLDDEGAVLGQGLKGVGGLTELARVIVAGEAAPQASPEALIVNAQAIYVVP